MSTQTQRGTEAPRLLNVDQATARLNVGRSTTFSLIKSGALASLKIGKRRLIPAEAIDAFVKAHVS